MSQWEQLNIRLGLLFSKLGIPPNLWTIGSIVPALLGFAALYYHNLLAGLGFFALSSVIGAIDGAVARVTQSVSNLGAFLNGVVEKYVEILFYVGLFIYLQTVQDFIIPNSLWMLLLVFGSLMPDFIKAYSDHRKVITDVDTLKRMEGIYGRNSRIILLYAGMLLGSFNATWLAYTIALATILVNLASIQRVVFVVKKSRQP